MQGLLRAKAARDLSRKVGSAAAKAQIPLDASEVESKVVRCLSCLMEPWPAVAELRNGVRTISGTSTEP